MAETLRVNGGTVRRWLSGATRVPGPAMVALELLLTSNRPRGGRNVRPGTIGSDGEKPGDRD